MNTEFGFHLPTRVEVGCGNRRRVGELARALDCGRRALVVTDPGILNTGIVSDVTSSLSGQGFSLDVFSDIHPNPRDVDCQAGGQAAREMSADLIIAVGGGSVIDAAKAIALLNTHPGNIADYAGRGTARGPVTPLVAVPTTAGTGSEVTRSSVITDSKRKIKFTVKDLLLAPALAVVDPETTYGLPPALTASTGMDALVHAIEAYTCRVAQPLSDAMALRAMGLIWAALPAAVENGGDMRARFDMMVGSLMAGIAFSHADVGAVHCMAESLGGLYDTPHGIANSIFLPPVTAFNAETSPERHARAATACGLNVAGLSAPKAASVLVRELARLSARIGIPGFREIPGVDPCDFPVLAAASYTNGSTPSNCREITEDDYLELFSRAFHSE